MTNDVARDHLFFGLTVVFQVLKAHRGARRVLGESRSNHPVRVVGVAVDAAELLNALRSRIPDAEGIFALVACDDEAADRVTEDDLARLGIVFSTHDRLAIDE